MLVKKYTRARHADGEKKYRQYSQRERVIEAPLARENLGKRERERARYAREVCLFVSFSLKTQKSSDA
jgi:hypothetical protein